MLNFFKSKETHRIEFLFNSYRNLKNQGMHEESALLGIIGEIKTRRGLVKDKEWFYGPNIEAKKRFIGNMFGVEIYQYSIDELIGFIIRWEFPEKYNYIPTIEQIRSNDHPSALLNKKVIEIGSKLQ